VNAYRFAWTCSGMGHVYFKVFDGQQQAEMEYASIHSLEPYYMQHLNEQGRQDAPHGVNLLRYHHSHKPVSQDLLDAFNAWRLAEHLKSWAHLEANPARYGVIAADDPLRQSPEVLRGGWYVVGRGWVETATPHHASNQDSAA